MRFFWLFLTSLFIQVSFAQTFNPYALEHYLLKPPTKPPYPAVLLLHASAGIEPAQLTFAQVLQANGYAVYIIDSFTPHGIKDRKSAGWEMATQIQLNDISQALQYLKSLTFIDKNKIALIGFSMGAYTTLSFMQTKKAQDVKAAIAFYPLCKRLTIKNMLLSPTLILIGKEDDRSDFKTCKKLLHSNLNKLGYLSLIAYNQALHGFDNAAFSKHKEIIDEKGEHYHLGFNKAARNNAYLATLSFLHTTFIERLR